MLSGRKKETIAHREIRLAQGPAQPVHEADSELT